MSVNSTALPPRVSAIVPARDEGMTIRGVVEGLVGHPLVGEVIVVDDASTDDTAERAREAGAMVLAMPQNGGKAAAMMRGMAAARYDVVFFSDADLIGMNHEMVSRIVEPVTSGRFAMYVGIRGRKTYWANRLLHFTPILGGQRALRRELWDQVPPTYKKNFQIEIALNFFAKLNGHRMGFTVVHGFGQVIKEKKRGLLPGLWQRMLMIRDILVVSGRLYVVLRLRLLFGPRLGRPGIVAGR